MHSVFFFQNSLHIAVREGYKSHDFRVHWLQLFWSLEGIFFAKIAHMFFKKHLVVFWQKISISQTIKHILQFIPYSFWSYSSEGSIRNSRPWIFLSGFLRRQGHWALSDNRAVASSFHRKNSEATSGRTEGILGTWCSPILQSAKLHRADGRDFKSVRVTLKDNSAKGGMGGFCTVWQQGNRKDKSYLPDSCASQ